jgi:catechol 2,3-dioxygenase-like lactoylglutathione lyase family enzyme
MIGYVMVGTNDLNGSAKFYDPVLASLGLARGITEPDYIGYGSKQTPKKIEFYLTRPFNGEAATFGNGAMIAMLVKSRSDVDNFHTTALANGGVDEGKPGTRIDGDETYYAYARDPDGNKICGYCE